MLKIENVSTSGWEAAIRGMRNPKNSWEKSDSKYGECDSDCASWDVCKPGFKCPIEIKINSFGDSAFFSVGKNDMKLMTTLANAGTDHGKFMRMIIVTLDIVAPLYWWKEFDTYKVGTTANSCSTMHKIAAMEFAIEDFSDEHLETGWLACLGDTIIPLLNRARTKFIETKDKRYWWQMIQLLPSSYNQRRTVMLNYAVLQNIYHARRNHKLDEWHTFCDWIESLPYSDLITGITGKAVM